MKNKTFTFQRFFLPILFTLFSFSAFSQAPPAPQTSTSNSVNGCSTSFKLSAYSLNAPSGLTHRYYLTQTGFQYITPTVTPGTPPGTYVTEITVTQTTTYWVAARNSSGQESSRTRVMVTFTTPDTTPPSLQLGPPPSSPLVTKCGPTATFALSAGGGGTNSIYRWYNSSNTDGTPVFTGAFYNPTITDDGSHEKTFWVRATLTKNNNCYNGPNIEETKTIKIFFEDPVLAPSIVGTTTREVCVGQGATFVVSNPIGGATYRWYNPSGTHVGTGSSWTVTPGYTGVPRDYQVIATTSAGCVSPARTVTVNVLDLTAPVVGSSGTNDCTSDSRIVSVNSGKTINGEVRNDLVHVWYSDANGNNIVPHDPVTGAPSGTLATQKTITSQSTVSYWVSAKLGNCESDLTQVTSTYTNYTLNPGGISAVPPVCYGGDPETINGTLPNGGDGNFTYQWETSPNGNDQWSPISSNGTSQSYNPPSNQTQTRWYRRLDRSCGLEEPTNVIEVVVRDELNPGSITGGGQNLCEGQNPGLLGNGSAPFGGDTSSYTYQWSQSTTENGSYTPISNTNSLTYIPPSVVGTRWYRREVTSCAETKNTPPVSVTIVTTPTISVSEDARNICPSTDIKITATTTESGTVEHFWWNDPTLNDPITNYQIEDTGGTSAVVTYLTIDGLGLTNGTGTYWVSAIVNGCETARVPVTATYVDDCGSGGDDCMASGVNDIFFPTAGGSETFTIAWNLPQCEEGVYLKTNTFEDPPVWLGVQKNPSNNFVLTVGENDSGDDRTVPLLLVNELGEAVGQLSFNVTQPTCSNQVWYPDNDLDNEGDPFEEPVIGCAKPYGNWTMNPYGGTSTAEDLNWILTKVYDISNTFKVSGKAYFDELGKPIQNQNWNVKTDSTWASQILYDPQGRPAISTLLAPIRQGSDFLYKTGFVKQTNNNTNYNFSNFTGAKLEDPDAVGDAPNTLGWYYSENNDREGYQDVTDHPYSKTIYSTLMPGSALRAIGGNMVDSDGNGSPDAWPQGYTFSMRASQELAQIPAFGDTQYNSQEITKTVTRDVHGVENVIFTDTDGRTLAVARSGDVTSRSMTIAIEDQGYVDVHVPQGSNMGFTITTGGIAVTVYDLITETTVTASTSLPNGFYRVTVNSPDTYVPGTVQISYKENYYDYSLNEFDKASRLIASYQPLNKLKTDYQYNTLGQLVYTKSPDEGEAWFKYREDGQIRFSQNSKQKFEAIPEEFSYTNYDTYGRPVESGVLVNDNFDSVDPDVPTLPLGTKKEISNTVYDEIPVVELQTLPSGYQNPAHLSGSIAKTSNDQSTTYYSYDIYGRVQWLVQLIQGLGTKTIDYTYDEITGQMSEVVFQKGISTEEFTHFYTYNSTNQLVRVETATYGSTRTLHAEYNYYESGALKRTELAGGIQGMDYVYNLGGQLKSMNHPSLSPTQDPGGDSNDLFGMQLDYHNTDYNRAVSNISSQTYGTELFNGNIKGIRWNNNAVPGNAGEQKYSYSYDRNNWLTTADFEGNGNSNSGILADDSSNAIFQSGESFDLQATNSYTLLPGFNAQEGSTGIIQIVEDTGTGGDGDYDVTNITYDANGNILSLNRNKNATGNGNAMDDLSYVYKTDKPNQLLRVDDAAGDVAGADDIDDQNGDNYVYNAIGQLVSNTSEGIGYEYNASGLVTEVTKNNLPLVKFFYNNRNHRVRKESYVSGNLQSTTYYVRDVTGSVRGIYSQLSNSAVSLVEQPVYGPNRLAVYFKESNSTVYQLTDHLGNVRAAFAVNSGTIDIRSGSDYYPFGMAMPGRTMVGDFRYTFQGQERDSEIGKEAFQLRLWDSRIGRWLTTDPAGQFYSPYLGMGNNPMNGVDPDGAFWEEFFNWVAGNGWNSNAALDFQANGGVLGEWFGSSRNGYRQGTYTGEDFDSSYGTAFKSVDDFWNYDVFDFNGKVALGQLNQISLDGDAGALGVGGAFNWSKVMFLGGDYGNYWYTYTGGEGGLNFGAGAGGSGDISTELFVAIYNGPLESSPSPKNFEGEYISFALAGEVHVVAGGSVFISGTYAGDWTVYSIGAGIGIGANAKISGELRVGKSTLRTDITPTNKRTTWDVLSNKLIHTTPLF